MKILFVASEVHPLVKTGGLADVAGSLPRALQALGHDVALLLPAYRDVLVTAAAHGARLIATRTIAGHHVRLLQMRLPRARNWVWLVDCPELYDRAGGPYQGIDGGDHADNAQRFALLCRTAALVAEDGLGLDWRADVVHCNDWQTALVPLLLHDRSPRPALVFTIHNLAYRGLFPAATLDELGLPRHLWHPDALEFHGMLSFIKAGILFADRINTVSPRYAQEILQPQFGCGLDGLLRHRAHVLSGILNGIDDREWNPARDRALARRYGPTTLERKRDNKRALQEELGLLPDGNVPLLAFIGRMVEQKGTDLLLAALPVLAGHPAQAVLLGSGAPATEAAFAALAQAHPGRIVFRSGYDEALAHRIEAGADMFLMPSRFEPCGLNQMYSLRYGTVPVVHAVGGLADTVIDATKDALADGTANGFCFGSDTPQALLTATRRALTLFEQPMVWRQLQQTGMRTDFSWLRSARAYEALYASATSATVTG